jgi:putative transposase
VPRVARREVADGVHHVTARGNGKQDVFTDDADRHLFMKLLRDGIRRFDWRCLTYCLMGNHFHLLVMTPQPTLGAGMHRLNGLYAQRFNARHSRSGHVWENRYYSEPLQGDPHLLAAFSYIALNPVRAGVCAQPDGWQWSGHGALAGLCAPGVVDVDAALAYFAADGGDGRRRYLDYVAAANLKRDCPSLGS